jgi:hypothetical protein
VARSVACRGTTTTRAAATTAVARWRGSGAAARRLRARVTDEGDSAAPDDHSGTRLSRSRAEAGRSGRPRVRAAAPVRTGATVVPGDVAAASAHGATAENEAEVPVPVRDTR